MKDIVIYGTGKYGEKVYNFLANVMGMVPQFFVKSNAEEGEVCHGFKVIGVNEFIAREIEDIVVIIAIANRKAVMEIKQQLYQKGFQIEQIIEINSFFLDNLIIFFEASENIDQYKCLCCNHYVKYFLPNGEKSSLLFNQHHVIGGGIERILYAHCVVQLIE